ncbi:uncharacterized protein LOC107270233 isoform X2 [Cephus cinctus]|uniref:Uncharacterized protein LOC107270233 isoform X2 n=1 Tax=Cephus cinctus TaxID=211228 RepID=A0AAJ7FNH6_CEPCN|nr:uncharacterized protein LOC107270233 isoform X2 [Cephus cinctus]
MVLLRVAKKTWEQDDPRERDGSAFEITSPKGGSRLRRWLIAILIFLFVSLVAINSFTIDQLRIARLGHVSNQDNNTQHFMGGPKLNPATGYLVRNKGCRIPALDPFDPAIRRYVHKEKPIVCDFGNNLPLVESNDSHIFVNPEARGFYYNKDERVKCCWREFWREANNDESVTFAKDCNYFEEWAIVTAEFIKVECTKKNEKIYRDYHAFVPHKPQVESRCQKKLDTRKDVSPLSVLIVGLDSISRMNFHRMMPKTVEALRKLEAVEMLGYNKVGDNTYPNIVPVLSGLSQEELVGRCWDNRKKPFDECPFLWKNFSASGYRTIFGEDACEMTTFNYLKPGFKKQPTDYYLRPYCIAAEHDIGNTHKLNADICLGTRKNFDNLLNYTRKVINSFAEDPYFAFFWQSSLTHDFFNFPQLGDESYRQFFEYVGRDDLLMNTALVIMSDHGMRWGDFRQTYQGRLEGSLPFVFLVLPKWWRKRFPVAWANLHRNTRSLTTPFDLHETLLDILHPENLREMNLKNRTNILGSYNGENIPRGISWFLPVPDHRTCTTAGIPGHWCMCHDSRNVSLNDPDLQGILDFFLQELNRMLADYRQCAVLKLKSLMDAKVWTGKIEADDKKAPWTDYTISIQTYPGDAIFEGSIRNRFDNSSNSNNSSNTKELLGSISRLNTYGKQSACVDDFNMRLYCYCL